MNTRLDPMSKTQETALAKLFFVLCVSADLLMALGQGEGAREYFADGRAAAEISKLWAVIERSVKAIRGQVSATGTMHKQAA